MKEMVYVLDFIFMTLSIAGGIIIAMLVMLLLMLQPCVMKWYSKQTMKTLESLANITSEETEDK